MYVNVVLFFPQVLPSTTVNIIVTVIVNKSDIRLITKKEVHWCDGQQILLFVI